MPVHVLRWRCEKDQETALLRTVKFFSKKEKMRKKGALAQRIGENSDCTDLVVMANWQQQ